MRFSERMRIKPVRMEIQRESMDDPLRNKLWSAVQIALFDKVKGTWVDGSEVDGSEFEVVIKRLWIHFFKLPLDTLPERWIDVQAEIRGWFFGWKWYEVYDFIEALAQYFDKAHRDHFIHLANSFMEDEMSAYRFIDDQIGEMTSQEEIASIEEAIANTSGIPQVREHLREALSKLTDRKNPDYRNSIKESISAVEAICKVIAGDPKATLGQALKRLKDNGVALHTALEGAWSKLYGYTSDEGGIRHALSDLPQTTFADAKYMLVSCSAFVNYLLELAREAGIPLERSQ